MYIGTAYILAVYGMSGERGTQSSRAPHPAAWRMASRRIGGFPALIPGRGVRVLRGVGCASRPSRRVGAFHHHHRQHRRQHHRRDHRRHHRRTIGATATGAGQQPLQDHPRFATLDNPPPSSPPDDNPPPSPPSRDRQHHQPALHPATFHPPPARGIIGNVVLNPPLGGATHLCTSGTTVPKPSHTHTLAQ